MGARVLCTLLLAFSTSTTPQAYLSTLFCCRQWTAQPLHQRRRNTIMGAVWSNNDGRINAAIQGKVILLTGATGGLGEALALELSQRAAASVSATMTSITTLILSARRLEQLRQLEADCRARIGPDRQKCVQFHLIPADLADPTSVQELTTTALQKCPCVDILINNGGVSSRAKFIDTAMEVDERVMQINYFAGLALCKAVVPKMIQKRSGAAIVWVSSVQGLLGIPHRTSYASSKFAVQGLCESLRGELHHANIAVLCVSPGYIRTNLSRSALTGTVNARHGRMDASTSAGADPGWVASQILKAIACRQTDLVVAVPWSARAALWLKVLWPGLLHRMLVRRFAKTEQQWLREQQAKLD